MATLEDILKAKQPDVWEQLMGAGADPTPGPAVPADPVASPVPSLRSTAPAQTMAAPDRKDLENAEQQTDYERRLAKANTHGRRATAIFLGNNPDQVDTRDIEDTRRAPLEAYKRREDARLAANKALVEAAGMAHTQAQTADIPLNRQQQAQEEQGRNTRQQAEIGSREGISAAQLKNARQLEGMRQAGENSRYSPYEVKVNPMTGEQQVVNRHTGGISGDQEPADPEVVQAYQERKLLSPANQKTLEDERKAQADVGAAIKAVEAHPGAAANWVDRITPKTGLLHTAGDYISNNIARSPEEREARAQALKASDAAIKAMAGARGFSGTELPTLQQFAGGPTDTKEQLISKMKAGGPQMQRDISRIENKLPIKHKGQAPAAPEQAAPTVVGGKKFHMINGQLMVED